MTEQSQPQVPVPGEQRSALDQAKMIVAGIAGAALILFFLQNLQEAEIHFLFWTGNIATIWALLLSALLGAVSMFLLTTVMGRRGKRPPEQGR